MLTIKSYKYVISYKPINNNSCKVTTVNVIPVEWLIGWCVTYKQCVIQVDVGCRSKHGYHRPRSIVNSISSNSVGVYGSR